MLFPPHLLCVSRRSHCPVLQAPIFLLQPKNCLWNTRRNSPNASHWRCPKTFRLPPIPNSQVYYENSCVSACFNKNPSMYSTWTYLLNNSRCDLIENDMVWLLHRWVISLKSSHSIGYFSNLNNSTVTRRKRIVSPVILNLDPIMTCVWVQLLRLILTVSFET